MLAGGSIAVAALGSSFAFVTKTLAGVGKGHILTVIVVALLVVAIPTLIIAWVKLRRRDLSAILEGSGWAINARMRLSRAQSRTFTQRPAYPFGSLEVGPRRGRKVLLWALLAALLAAWGYIAYVQIKVRQDEAAQSQVLEQQQRPPQTSPTPAGPGG